MQRHEFIEMLKTAKVMQGYRVAQPLDENAEVVSDTVFGGVPIGPAFVFPRSALSDEEKTQMDWSGAALTYILELRFSKGAIPTDAIAQHLDDEYYARWCAYQKWGTVYIVKDDVQHMLKENTLETFSTGARRDSSTGKPRYDLIPLLFLQRVAAVLSEIAHTGHSKQTDDILTLVAEWQSRVDNIPPASLNYAAASMFYVLSDYTIKASDTPLAHLPPDVLKRLALHLTAGAEKYGEHNWQKGMDQQRTYQSLMRHMWAWVASESYPESVADDSEDHAAAVLANLMFMWWDAGGKDA